MRGNISKLLQLGIGMGQLGRLDGQDTIDLFEFLLRDFDFLGEMLQLTIRAGQLCCLLRQGCLRPLGFFVEPGLLDRDAGLAADRVQDPQLALLKLSLCAATELHDSQHLLMAPKRNSNNHPDLLSFESPHAAGLSEIDHMNGIVIDHTGRVSATCITLQFFAMSFNVCWIAIAAARHRRQRLTRRIQKADHTDIEVANLKGLIENPFHHNSKVKGLQDRVADRVESLELPIARLGLAEQPRVLYGEADLSAHR